MKKLAILLSLTFMFISCGHKKDAKSFVEAIEAHSGQDYSIAKLHTETGQYVVLKNNDTGEYEAYNMDKWDRKNNTSYSDFISNGAVLGTDFILNLEQQQEYISDGYTQDVYETHYEYYEYYDDYCECWVEDYDTYDVWVDSYWVDTSYWYTYYTGGGYSFSNTQKGSKDLEMLASVKEDIQKGLIAYTLKSEFKLSTSRSKELAKLVTKFQKLENIRSLTDSEKNEFAMDALGVSYSSIESAVRKKSNGENSEYESLLKEASVKNETSAEQIGRFFNEYVDQQI